MCNRFHSVKIVVATSMIVILALLGAYRHVKELSISSSLHSLSYPAALTLTFTPSLSLSPCIMIPASQYINVFVAYLINQSDQKREAAENSIASL